MTTLIDARNKINAKDTTTIYKTYSLINLRIKELMHEIKKHEKQFSSYTIKYHPIAGKTLITIQELETLEKLPQEYKLIKNHANDLSNRLRTFKALIGTAFCNTPNLAYNALANDVVKPFKQNIENDINKQGIRMPEIFLLFRETYTQILIEAARTQEKKI